MQIIELATNRYSHVLAEILKNVEITDLFMSLISMLAQLKPIVKDAHTFQKVCVPRRAASRLQVRLLGLHYA
jgi:hypothetical protein